MRFPCLFLLASGSLLAQAFGSAIIDWDAGIVNQQYGTTIFGQTVLLSNIQYSWTITRNADMSKSYSFSAKQCFYLDLSAFGEPTKPVGPQCKTLTQSQDQTLAPAISSLKEFYSYAPTAVHNKPDYFAKPARPLLTVIQPSAPVDPQMIFYDGISNNIVDFDLTAEAILNQVTIPISTFVSTFGIRPSITGPSSEVWAASPQQGIFVVNVGTGTLTANIPIPSLDPGNTVSRSVVFTNSGATALYLVSYYTADAAGNNGALLTFDVASRTLISTMLLKSGATVMLMAADGLTAYLLSNNEITYYDVYSGTADLTASTATPGVSSGYSGIGSLFIHPDGTRLFWSYGASLAVFDLTTRKVTNMFNSGLTSVASIAMSQDGSNVWLIDSSGNISIVDTRYGNILGMLTASPGTAVYPGPAN